MSKPVPMEARRAPPLRPSDYPIKLMSHRSARRYALSRLTHAYDLVSTTIYCEPGLNDDEHVLAVPGADANPRTTKGSSPPRKECLDVGHQSRRICAFTRRGREIGWLASHAAT